MKRKYEVMEHVNDLLQTAVSLRWIFTLIQDVKWEKL